MCTYVSLCVSTTSLEGAVCEVTLPGVVPRDMQALHTPVLHHQAEGLQGALDQCAQGILEEGRKMSNE